MARSLRRVGLGLSAALVLWCCAPEAPPSLRSSLRAAYRAFQDPGLLDARPAPAKPPRPAEPPVGRAPLVREPDVDEELRSAAPDDLDDPEGAALSALTLPDLRVPITRRALRFARYFGRTEAGRKVFLGCYRRGAAHRVAIEDALRKAGLPLDLAWLPAIESGFDPRAVSPAGAAGLWQLMPETARAHGLSRSTWLDERLDPSPSTRAALSLLRELHDRFGRWDLALAAYNAGSGRIESALERFGRARGDGGAGPVTFAELAAARLLPDETASYVPQVAAFALVAINAERFGLDVPDALPAAELAALAVPPGTRLETVARAASLSEEALRALNPALLGDRVPPEGEVRVKVPVDRVAAARAALPSLHDNEVVLPNDEEDPPAEPVAESVEPAHDAPRPAAPRPVIAASARPAPTIVPVLAAHPVIAAQPAPREEILPLLAEAPVADAGAPDAEPPAEEPAAAPAADPLRVQELPNGVVVRVRRDVGATSIAVTTRVASAEGAGEARSTLVVRPRDLVAGLELAAARVRASLGEGGGVDLFDLRRRAGAARRKQLEKAPYGRSWITLGDALFPLSPKLHPLSGTVLGATADPAALRDTLLAEAMQAERGHARASITVVGDVDEGYALRLAEAIAGPIPAPPPLDTSLPRPDRIFLTAPVSEARGLYGWVARAETADDEAALRVALELLEGGGIERVLVGDAGLATDAHAGAELVGARTWVVTLEASIAPGHTIVEVEKALDAELARLAEGADAAEVRAAVDRARERAAADLAAADAVTGPAGGPSAALAASLRRASEGARGAEVSRKIGAVGAAAVGAAIRRFLPADRRVVVITTPRGNGAEQRVAAR